MGDPKIAEILELVKGLKPRKEALLSVKKVAEKLDVTVDTVWKYSAANVIPKPVKISGSTRWKLSEIDAHIATLSSND